MTALTALLLAGASLGLPPTNPPPGWAEDALDLAQDAGMFGGATFDPDTGALSGGFVRATVDLETGGLTDYQIVAGLVAFPVFSRVTATPQEACSLGEDGPASLVFDCSTFTLRTHNDPTRALLYEAVDGDVAVAFTGAPGTFMAGQDGSVLVAGMGFQAQLTLLNPDGSAGILPEPDGGVLTASLTTGAKVVFRATPQEDEGAVGRWAQGAVLASLARGRLGGELFLVSHEGGLLEDGVPYRDFTFASHFQDSETLVVTVTSPSTSGALVVTNLHRDVLGVTDLDRLELRVDGELVERTDNVDALPTTTSEDPLYYAAAGPNGLFLLVHIDHFSERTLTVHKLVQDLFQPVTGQVLLLAGLGAAVTVLAAAVLFRRGREEW